jgi:hypothetical protein
MPDPPVEFFERCPRCLKAWDLFPVFQCPSCQSIFCGCCDEDDLPDDEARWLAAAWDELKVEQCPVCTMQITSLNRLGRIKKPARGQGQG